jgi:uncharacterized membrane protein YfcA
VPILLKELIIAAVSVLGGFFGALTGLGGGSIVVPLLVLGFGVDLRYAIGASLIAIIATSSGSAVAFVRDGYSNVRIGMFLEIATTLGALTGAYISTKLSNEVIGVFFAVTLMYVAYNSLQKKGNEEYKGEADWWAKTFRLNGTYPKDKKIVHYNVTAVPGGFSLMYVAGILSALLGIGGGIMKVPAMDKVMKIPFKVSTTTSNFMIGVTAAASAGVYLGRGLVDPSLAMPVMLGILVGSIVGAKVLPKLKVDLLRKIFALLVCIAAVQMIYKYLTGKL